MDKQTQEEHEPHPAQGSIRVTLYPLNPLAHELHKSSYTRYFPNEQTYERVREHFQWDYLAIEAWEGTGEAWAPDAKHTFYSGMWRGKKITTPTPQTKP